MWTSWQNCLFSTHIVYMYKRLSAMQGLARLQESFAHFGQNTLFLLSHYPSPRIGISHGGLRKFGYEAGKMSHWSLLEGKVLCSDNYVIQMCRKLLDFFLFFSLNALINVVVPSVVEHWGSTLAELVVQPFVQLMLQGTLVVHQLMSKQVRCFPVASLEQPRL